MGSEMCIRDRVTNKKKNQKNKTKWVKFAEFEEKMKEHFETYGEILEVVRSNYCMKGGMGNVEPGCWVCGLLCLLQDLLLIIFYAGNRILIIYWFWIDRKRCIVCHAWVFRCW